MREFLKTKEFNEYKTLSLLHNCGHSISCGNTE